MACMHISISMQWEKKLFMTNFLIYFRISTTTSSKLMRVLNFMNKIYEIYAEIM